MSCKHVATNEPRILPGRHDSGQCPEGAWHPPLTFTACGGCERCPINHCQVCGRTHVAELTCPGCIGDTRDNLSQIVTMSGQSILAEAIRRGINSEAAMLAGPAANPETFGYRAASAFWGRIDAAWLNDCRDEKHPLWVLGTWDQLVTEHYGHERTRRVTVVNAAAYLAANLSDLAQDDGFAFDEMAGQVRATRAHMQVVLGDADAGDPANVACFDCGGSLSKKLTTSGFDDCWTCGRCRRRYTYAEYNFALRAKLEEGQTA